jgi:VWFA-related protein
MLLILLLGVAAAAQTQETITFRAGVSNVRVDALVTNGDRVVEDLTKDDFVIQDNGRPVNIVYFGHDSEQLHLVLLLDISGSMRQHLEPMADTARQALKHLEPGDRVAIMIFARTNKVHTEFTDNHAVIEAALREAVRDESLGAATLINPALADAVKHIEEQPAQGRRAVLIITDNQALHYKTPDEEVIRAFYGADTVLSAIVIGKAGRPEAANSRKQINPDFSPANVFRIAEETGGEAVKAEKAAAAFAGMIERIRTRYSLHYSAPDAPAGTFRKIHVDLSPAARERYPQARVRARQGYYVR